MDPRYPNTLYAAAHQRRRHVYTYISGGPESAIYKSIDGGESWNKLSEGLPEVDLGRIGMDISPVNPDYVYAIIEAADKKGGFFRIAPSETNLKFKQLYWPETNVLVTRFLSEKGAAELAPFVGLFQLIQPALLLTKNSSYTLLSSVNMDTANPY